MKMREIQFGAQPPIDGYGPGGFRIGAVWYEGSLLASAQGVEHLALPLSREGLARVLALAGEVDVLLVGQGAEIAPLLPQLRAEIEAAGMGVEVMSTPSACRTYNVLLSEARRVAALLTAL
ncbi:MAG: Mth938-like domain-containing protein [Pikeienuella sp.]